MKLSLQEFQQLKNIRITLLGMSGVGKTWLAMRLRKANWFHYSGDYRIGTRYLDEAILDNLKEQVMQIPYLKDLLRSDSIYISNNLSVDNLQTVSSFLGKLGDPELGGLGLGEFRRRQKLHREAEIAAMNDVPYFIEKAARVYGYKHFINDAGGSLCELDEPGVIEQLNKHTIILYIKASEQDKHELLKRAESSPKPLYFREDFLNSELKTYLNEHSLKYAAMINPDDFSRWVFPRLLTERVPRYEAIAKTAGYTVASHEIASVNSESDFIKLLETAISRQG